MLSKVERWMTAAKKILVSLTGGDKRRRKKRQASPDKKVCDFVYTIMYALNDDGGIKDGAHFSFSKIKVANIFNDELEDMENMANSQSFDHCHHIDRWVMKQHFDT